MLGVPETLFEMLNGKSSTPINEANVTRVRLPEPWAKFLQIERQAMQVPDAKSGHCAVRVWFEVYPLHESYIAFYKSRPEAQDLAQGHKAEASDGQLPGEDRLIQIAELDDWSLFVSELEYLIREALFKHTTVPKYEFDELLDQFAEGAVDPSVPLRVKLDVPSGLFNFIESLGTFESYSYAIFPKNDVVGVFADVSAQVSGGVAELGRFGFARRLVESRTDSVLVGFADGRPSTKDAEPSARFGWVVSSAASMQPTTKTQLALVSVPAWTDQLNLEVTTGWVGHDGHPMPARQGPSAMSVRVPPDVTAFDSIFRDDDWFTRRPSVQHSPMSERIYVLANQPAQILIPGLRL